MFCIRFFNIFRDKCFLSWLVMIDWLYVLYIWVVSFYNLRLIKIEIVWEVDININLWIFFDVKNTYIFVLWILVFNIFICKKKNYFYIFDKEMYEWILFLVRILKFKYYLFGISFIVWFLVVFVGGRVGLIWFCFMLI